MCVCDVVVGGYRKMVHTVHIVGYIDITDIFPMNHLMYHRSYIL